REQRQQESDSFHRQIFCGGFTQETCAGQFYVSTAVAGFFGRTNLCQKISLSQRVAIENAPPAKKVPHPTTSGRGLREKENYFFGREKTQHGENASARRPSCRRSTKPDALAPRCPAIRSCLALPWPSVGGSVGKHARNIFDA